MTVRDHIVDADRKVGKGEDDTSRGFTSRNSSSDLAG